MTSQEKLVYTPGEELLNSLTHEIGAGLAIAALADSICPRAIALNFDTLIKNMDLDAWRVSCR